MFRDGKLVLIKSFFESILIFWIPLSWIPKDILKRMHKFCFTYMWRGSVDHQVMAWIHWEHLAIQKALRGRGLKIYFFLQKHCLLKFLGVLLIQKFCGIGWYRKSTLLHLLFCLDLVG